MVFCCGGAAVRLSAAPAGKFFIWPQTLAIMGMAAVLGSLHICWTCCIDAPGSACWLDAGQVRTAMAAARKSAPEKDAFMLEPSIKQVYLA
jgi:hypothetical protein